jgi:hypothetical protein
MNLVEISGWAAWAGLGLTFLQVIYHGVKNWKRGRTIPITWGLVLSAVLGVAGLFGHWFLPK